MSDETLKFANEEARIEAMNALDETPDSLVQLERIKNAAIEAPVQGTEDRQQGTEINVALPAEPQPPATQTAPEQQTQSEPTAPASIGQLAFSFEDLQKAGFTYTTPADVIKGLQEKEELIQRQKKFIKEKMDTGQGDAQKRISELEAAIAQMQQTSAPAQPLVSQGTQPQIDVAKTQKLLSDINTIQTELDRIKEEDPDKVFDDAYQSKQWELSKLQTQLLSDQQALLLQTQTEALNTRQSTDAYLSDQKRGAEEERRRKAIEAEYADIQSAICDPEFKAEFNLSKPFSQIEAEYQKWKFDVANAYLKRPPQNQQEISMALSQLQIRNSDLINTCQVMGIAAAPTTDMENYLKVCEYLDYQNGWRKDSLGKFDQVKRYDPVTGNNIPVILPDLKTAIRQKRHEEGFYTKEKDQAYQQGAQDFAAAQTKRDPAVAELNSPTTIGQTNNYDTNWAIQYLAEVDEEEIAKELRRGITTKLDEFNKARGILGMKSMSL
jgi:hypothetical protein